MAIEPKFESHEKAVKAGWFSRRHETNKELEESRARNKAKREAKFKQSEPEEELKLCPTCNNSYDLTALCFDDDPEHKICNGCFRTKEHDNSRT